MVLTECFGKSVLISGHINPDHDALCSCIALQNILEQNGIEADIMLKKPLDSSFEYFDEQYDFVYEAKKPYEVVITLDSAELKMLPDNVLASMNEAKMTFNIDHHYTNAKYATYNCVKSELSSACEVLYSLFKNYFKLNQKLAEAFYMGLYTDTGGFIYSNTKSGTFKCLADLVAYGLNGEELLNKCFRGKSISAFNITKQAFDSVRFYANDTVVVSILRATDFEQTQANLNESKFVVSYLPTIKGVKVAISVSEIAKNDIHVSLRTACEDVDVSKIAQQFGGGGHVKASGLTLKGDFDKAVQALINYTIYYLEHNK